MLCHLIAVHGLSQSHSASVRMNEREKRRRTATAMRRRKRRLQGERASRTKGVQAGRTMLAMAYDSESDSVQQYRRSIVGARELQDRGA